VLNSKWIETNGEYTVWEGERYEIDSG